MKTEELRRKIESIHVCGSGHWRVCISYRGKFYYSTTTNSLAIDRMKDYDNTLDRVSRYGYTYGQAVRALYDECKRKNNITKLNYGRREEI